MTIHAKEETVEPQEMAICLNVVQGALYRLASDLTNYYGFDLLLRKQIETLREIELELRKER